MKHINRLNKLNDKEVVSLFVKYLADKDQHGLQVDTWPDKEIRHSSEIDAIAGNFAIEHTSVDTIPNQRRDTTWFVKVVNPLENEFRDKLTFRLNIIFPYDGVQIGQNWSSITRAMRNWILNESSTLSMGRHTIKDVPGIPFEFTTIKKDRYRTGLIFSRYAPNDRTLSNRLKEQLDCKIKKLLPYKNRGKTTILLVESNDIALMNDGIMWDGLRLAYPNGWPQGLDQVWYADTTIPEEVSFTDMTQAVIR